MWYEIAIYSAIIAIDVFILIEQVKIGRSLKWQIEQTEKEIAKLESSR